MTDDDDSLRMLRMARAAYNQPRPLLAFYVCLHKGPYELWRVQRFNGGGGGGGGGIAIDNVV